MPGPARGESGPTRSSSSTVVEVLPPEPSARWWQSAIRSRRAGARRGCQRTWPDVLSARLNPCVAAATVSREPGIGCGRLLHDLCGPSGAARSIATCSPSPALTHVIVAPRAQRHQIPSDPAAILASRIPGRGGEREDIIIGLHQIIVRARVEGPPQIYGGTIMPNGSITVPGAHTPETEAKRTR